MEEPECVYRVARQPNKIGTRRKTTHRTFALTTRLAEFLQQRKLSAAVLADGAANDHGCGTPLHGCFQVHATDTGPQCATTCSVPQQNNAPPSVPKSPKPGVTASPLDLLECVEPRLRVQVTVERRTGSGRQTTPRELTLHVALPQLRRSPEPLQRAQLGAVSPQVLLPQEPTPSQYAVPLKTPHQPTSPPRSPSTNESQILADLAVVGLELGLPAGVQLDDLQQWLPRPLSLVTLMNLAREISQERERATCAPADAVEVSAVSSQQASFAPVGANSMTLAAGASAQRDMLTAARTPAAGHVQGLRYPGGSWRSPSPRHAATPVEGVPELFFWPAAAANACRAGEPTGFGYVAPGCRTAETCSTSGSEMTPIEGVPERLPKRRRMSAIPRPLRPFAALENTPAAGARHASLCVKASGSKLGARGHHGRTARSLMRDPASNIANGCGGDPAAALTDTLAVNSSPADASEWPDAAKAAGSLGDANAAASVGDITCDTGKENLTAAEIAAAASAAARAALRRLEALACTLEASPEAPLASNSGSVVQSEPSGATNSSGTPAVVKMQNLAVAVENAVQRATQAMGDLASCQASQSLQRAGLPPRPPPAALRTTAEAATAGPGSDAGAPSAGVAALGLVGCEADVPPGLGSIIHRAPPDALIFRSRTPSPMGGFQWPSAQHGREQRRAEGSTAGQDMVTPAPGVGMAPFVVDCTPTASPVAGSTELLPMAVGQIAAVRVTAPQPKVPQGAVVTVPSAAPPIAAASHGAAPGVQPQISAMPVAAALIAAMPVAAALMAAVPRAAPAVAAAPYLPAPVVAKPVIADSVAAAVLRGSNKLVVQESSHGAQQPYSAGSLFASDVEDGFADIQHARLPGGDGGPSSCRASPTPNERDGADPARALASVLRHDLERRNADEEELAMEEVAALPDGPNEQESEDIDDDDAAVPSGKNAGSNSQGSGEQRLDCAAGREARHRTSGSHVQERRLVVSRKSLANIGHTVDDHGARRSTRNRVRPLQYWRGEGRSYGRKHNTLPTVNAIKMRTPEPEWPLPSGKIQKAKRKARAQEASAAAAAAT